MRRIRKRSFRRGLIQGTTLALAHVVPLLLASLLYSTFLASGIVDSVIFGAMFSITTKQLINQRASRFFSSDLTESEKRTVIESFITGDGSGEGIPRLFYYGTNNSMRDHMIISRYRSHAVALNNRDFFVTYYAISDDGSARVYSERISHDEYLKWVRWEFTDVLKLYNTEEVAKGMWN